MNSIDIFWHGEKIEVRAGGIPRIEQTDTGERFFIPNIEARSDTTFRDLSFLSKAENEADNRF